MVEWIQRWRYRLEKGSPHLILLVGLLLLIIFFSVAGGFLVYISGVGEELTESMWWVFLRISDPGYLGDDSTVTSAFFGTLFTVIGMVVFMAGLVGILTSLIMSSLKKLHEGRSAVVFNNHVVVIGWNNEVFTLISELLTVWNDTGIAMLAAEPKETAEDEIERRVYSQVGQSRDRKIINQLKTRVVYRNGSPLALRDLQRVGVHKARHVIVLAGELERGTTTDVQQIRVLHAINQLRSNFGSTGDFTVIAELTLQQLRAHAFYALNMNPLADAWVRLSEQQKLIRGEESFLPCAEVQDNDQDITVVNGDQIVSRAVVQCAIQPSLSKVYNELLSFAGKELFLWRPNGAWQSVLEQAGTLPPEQVPLFLNAHLSTGMIVGIRESGSDFGELFFKPTDWPDNLQGNDLIILADKQEWQNPQPRSRENFELDIKEHTADPVGTAEPKTEEHGVLVLGFNRRLGVVMEQLSEYCEQYPDTQVQLTLVAPQIPQDFYQLADKWSVVADANAQGRLVNADFTDWNVLGPIIRNAPKRKSIILLTDDCALSLSDGSVDASVTLALVMLRAYRSDPAWSNHFEQSNIVAEILDPQNKLVIEREHMANDVIVGNEYVSRFIAQVTSDFRLEELFRELLDYGDYELYVKPVEHYRLNAKAPFCEVVKQAAVRSEVAIGYLYSEPQAGVKMSLAPDLMEPMENAERIIVIAES